MKTKVLLSAAVALIAFSLPSCEKDNSAEDGTIILSITDAPLDRDDVRAVHITINGLQYHKKNGDWTTDFSEYEGPNKVDLLQLTDGLSALLGNFEIEAGQYNQIRFLLDAPERGENIPSNPGCYLAFTGGETAPLYVPSTENAGFRETGAFTVPSNGDVEIPADFNARKSIVESKKTTNKSIDLSSL